MYRRDIMMDPVLLLKNSNESTTTSYCVYLLQEVVEFAACVQGASYHLVLGLAVINTELFPTLETDHVTCDRSDDL